ncbi:hypothetical protein GTO10_06735 [Candidatus Saccharibacteria bacterium]|nr:hypothetical protein [Candidatus Saccharibacteria bacterium]
MKKLYAVSLWVLDSDWGLTPGVLNFDLRVRAFVAPNLAKAEDAMFFWVGETWDWDSKIYRVDIGEIAGHMIIYTLDHASRGEGLVAVALCGLRIGPDSFEIGLVSKATIDKPVATVGGEALVAAQKRWPSSGG